MYRLLATLLFVTTFAYAGPITYTAVVGCNGTCVTVSLSWSDTSEAVNTAGVTDNLGNPLFDFSMPSPPSTTGSILPNPQTIFGLSSTVIQIITNGDPVNEGTALLAPASIGAAATVPTGRYANVYLWDTYGEPIYFERFVATYGSDVPEPATLSLVGGACGLVLILARRRKLHR